MVKIKVALVTGASSSIGEEVMTTADEPRVVADVALRAASAALPKVRYTAGGVAGRMRFLRTFLPAGAGIRKGRPARILARWHGCPGHREAGAAARTQDDPRGHGPWTFFPAELGST